MLTGYNTDFKFQNKIYHCQTEDGGVHSPFITSLLYHQGAILASRKTSYADIMKADCLDEVVRELMMEQHKQMIRDLMQGRLDLNNAPHEAAYQSAPVITRQTAPKEQPKPREPEKPKEPEKPREPEKVKEPEKAKEPPPQPKPPPPQPKEEDVKERSLDDIILDFLAQEQKERAKRK